MRKHKLWASDIVFTEDNIFFSSGQFNGLFKTGLHGGKAEFISFFPNDSKRQSRLYGDAFKYKDEILFLPDLSAYITLYNIAHNDFVCMKFPVENNDQAMRYWPQVVGGIMVDSCVYAFGAKYPCAVCYDFKTRQLKVYDDKIERFKRYGYKGTMPFFSRDIYLMGNSIFVRSLTCEVLVEFDTKTKKFDFHWVKEQKSGRACDDMERIWLLQDMEKSICAWNERSGLIQKVKVGELSERTEQHWQCSILFKNKMWVFPYLTGLIEIVDIQDGKINTMNLFKISMNERHKKDALGSVWFRKVYKNRLYFMSVLENKLYCFDENDNEEFCTDLYADRDKIIRLLFQSSDKLIDREQSLWVINYDIIDAVMLKEIGTAENRKGDIEFGKKIYGYVTK